MSVVMGGARAGVSSMAMRGGMMGGMVARGGGGAGPHPRGGFHGRGGGGGSFQTRGGFRGRDGLNPRGGGHAGVNMHHNVFKNQRGGGPQRGGANVVRGGVMAGQMSTGAAAAAAYAQARLKASICPQ